MKMTPAQIANKHYPDSKFEDCKRGCMSCNADVCESQQLAILELTTDIFNCLKWIIEDLMNKVDELNSFIPNAVEQSEQLVCEYCQEGNKPTCCDKCVDRINSMD